jgi:hypothetical protein
MEWNLQAYEHMVTVVERVVPEAFRHTALTSLKGDAQRYALQRDATEIEDRDLVQAIGQAPDFIQAALYEALAKMGVPVEQAS